jgi:morphogenetic protein associated with SpoVID
VKIHIVQKGDTLWKIAQKYGVDFEQLKKINGHLSNPDMIMPGMKIKVPTAGVPVKKEMQKKETKINIAPKKEEPNLEHPYMNAKPFISFDIESEVSPNININPPAKEAPKAPVGEVKKETPKPAVLEEPKAPVEEKPKEVPKEIQKKVLNEVPKSNVPETNKEKELEKAENVTPLKYTIPPVSPQANVNLAKQMPSMPPIPPKPANILPNIMKPEMDLESPETAKVEKDVSDENPPELPNIPYVPITPQQTFPEYGMPVQPNMDVPPQEQPCVPVTPVMPGYGFYYPPMPMAPAGYPSPQPSMPMAPVGYPSPQPSMPFHVESSSHPFPGIHESSSEFHEPLPPMPNVTAPNVNVEAAANIAPQAMEDMPMPYAPAPCVPITPVMPSYGWHPPTYPQPYMPSTPAYYPAPYPPQPMPTSFPVHQTGASGYPLTQAPMQQTYYPPAQPSAFPPTSQQLFMMPEYGESSDREQ